MDSSPSDLSLSVATKRDSIPVECSTCDQVCRAGIMTDQYHQWLCVCSRLVWTSEGNFQKYISLSSLTRCQKLLTELRCQDVLLSVCSGFHKACKSAFLRPSLIDVLRGTSLSLPSSPEIKQALFCHQKNSTCLTFRLLKVSTVM